MIFPKRACFFIFFYLYITCVTAAPLSEWEERTAINTSVAAAFNAEDYEFLEKASQAYRSKKSRTASGLWKLTLFYSGINMAIDAKEKDGETGFKYLESRIRAWTERYPKSPAPIMALSAVHISRAWNIRGSGYASTVKPEAWKPFSQSIERARQVLEDGKTFASIDPHWYEMMLEVAKLQNWERDSFDKLLNEALRREPLFYQTYFSALEYLLPKWNGDLGQIEVFALSAADRTAKSEGSGMYARIYWYASQTQFGSELFTSSAAQWPRMKTGFDDIVDKYPDRWNLNNYAKFACLAKDRDTTSSLLKRIGTSVEAAAWTPQLLENCAAWTAAPPAPAPQKHRPTGGS